MTDSPQTEYRPQSVSPPGETLVETLEALGMTQAELAARSGLAEKTISHIANAKAPITEATALALERVLGVSARFWLARESKYREFLARAEEEDLCRDHASWAKIFPYKRMADLGWVPPTSKADEKAGHLLRFFGVRDQACWRGVWRHEAVAFRKTARAPGKLEVVSAWLRQGELESRSRDLPAFDEKRFKANVHALRDLTTKMDAERFLAEIEHRCAEAGVCFLLVPELPSLGIYGVTRWLGGTPIIQQSLHLKSHDHFWFTFFHEAKHVLQKVKKRIFLEGDRLDHEDQKRENEADRFARELLIRTFDYNVIARTGDFSEDAIKRFANRLGIHPGIIVGRLLHDKLLPYNAPARKLQARMSWRE